ncbi:2083_t:CDS:1, partial [Rhizophagus irregularis]
EDEALSIIQETSEQDITENIELFQVNVDVHQTLTSGSDFGKYTKSQRLQIPRDIDVNYSFLPQRRVRYTSHPMPQSTSLNIESDVYNTSEQNTG